MTVTITCPRRHRDVALLSWSGTRAEILGTVVPENGDRGGTLTVSAPVHRPQRLAASVVDVDPANAGLGASSGKGRKKLVCNRRRHRAPKPSRVVTQEVLDASMRRFVAEDTERVSWLDLHA